MTTETLPGVRILVKGTATGVVTDLGGQYKIETEKGSVLVFSFLGMVAQERVLETPIS